MFLKSSPIIFLKLAIVAIGLIALALCFFVVPVLSHGVAEFLNMYYLEPLIMGGFYVASLLFFVALYQSFKLLGLIDRKMAFSRGSAKALRNIKYCGAVIGAVFALMMPIVYLYAEKDDSPGVIIVGAAFVGAALTVAAFAALLERLIEDALAIKSENDLTV